MMSGRRTYELCNRYVVTGTLVMKTAFHIGGGKATLSNSDSPVVLTPEGLPFIPGSSLKGALRSTVEKLVPGLPEGSELSTCALMDLNTEALKEARERGGRAPCPTVRQRDITEQRRAYSGHEEDVMKQVYHELCSTCRLFGSPYTAAHLSINDLYMKHSEWGGIIQRRDGVAIDRDSEKAKDRLKYDFEVVPASSEFELSITLENVTDQDLQLISVGLSDFVHGFGVIGGKRSRGLGACILTDLKVEALELKGKDIDVKTQSERLKNYLLKRTFSDSFTGEKFLEKYIEQIFVKKPSNDA